MVVLNQEAYMLYQRSLEKTTLKVSQSYPYVLLTGPRQVGGNGWVISMTEGVIPIDEKNYMMPIWAI